MFQIQLGENNHILRTVCTPVEKFDDALRMFAEEMEETMLETNGSVDPQGVGLAAPQVGVTKRLLLVTLNLHTRKRRKVVAMANPEILELSEKKVVLEEGCLSLPKIFGKVSRPAKVLVRWQNLEGNWCERKLERWDARIFLHENDHLNGILFTDYLKGKGKNRTSSL